MKRNPWPYAIIGYFVIFITGVITWITFAVRNDQQLVRADYYEHEITYQKQIEREARTASLAGNVLVEYDSGHQRVAVVLPPSVPANARGKISFYRPSDARLDRQLDLALDKQNSQVLDVNSLRPGLWKLRLTWSDGEREYAYEKALVLGGK